MKHVNAGLTVLLLVICLLGTHWIGVSHSVSHSITYGVSHSQALESKSTSQVDKNFNHSSDVCHLFDSLSLAGFIPNGATNTLVSLRVSSADQVIGESFFLKLDVDSYESRAPPTFIL